MSQFIKKRAPTFSQNISLCRRFSIPAPETLSTAALQNTFYRLQIFSIVIKRIAPSTYVPIYQKTGTGVFAEYLIMPSFLHTCSGKLKLRGASNHFRSVETILNSDQEDCTVDICPNLSKKERRRCRGIPHYAVDFPYRLRKD